MPMVPGMILTMRPVNPESWMNVVPILSQQLLARASLSGEPLPIADFSASLAACLLCTGVLLAIMTQQFSSERILRR